MAWEDPHHLLIAFKDGEAGDSEVIRLSIKGRLTTATDAIKTPRNRPGFVFAAS